ncbi:MAG: hypothetical protein HYY12_01860, partial [Candidatus Methylomirabilis oxyfera]|nr:hypothetical protein [Candidatus Methylomirabilis oxyfera]
MRKRGKRERLPFGMPFIVGVALATALHLAPDAAAERGVTSGAPRFGRIVRLDPRFDRLVPRNAVLEKIAGGFAWVEGPVWNREEGYLLFSDIPNNSIFKRQEGAGVSLFLKPSGYTGEAVFEGREPGSN